MRYAAAAIVLAIPLALVPRWFFYYDVTPKAAVLLAGVAILLLWSAWKPETALSFMTSRFGRWNAALTAAGVLLTIATAVASPIFSLAFNGSNWRRFGAVEQLATVVCAFLVAAIARSAPGCRLAILRALCLAGVLAGLYGIAQYFGFDPFLAAATYVVGEGKYQIVRPPGPLGHADYLAAFLLWPVFAGTALWAVDSRRVRWLGIAAVLTGVVALVLAGSRGAWLGLVVGLAILLWLHRPRIRMVAASLAIFAVIATAFYLSPAGTRLRARAFWISEDSTGGARLLLWRDSARMAITRPWTGFGADNFVAEFPRFQSTELARAYPDFYHESPHNLFLDGLTGQGVLGVVLLALWMILGISAGRRSVVSARPELRPVAAALLASLAASVVAQQFVVFIVPTAFTFYLGIGLLAGLAHGGRTNIRRPLRPAVAVTSVLAAGFFAIAGYWLLGADLALARVRRSLDAGDRGRAMELWQSAKTRTHVAGVTADLYFSRRWAAAASAAQEPLEKIRLGALAIDAAHSATTVPEQRQNAWYNYAILAASLDDPKTVESSLRAAIAAGPQWFKPHWALSRLLYSAGRKDEARQEALLALDLGGRRETEVVATTAEIVRSPAPLP